MVTYIKQGDIFALDVCSYAHGCNCAGAMGRGIALQFKVMFPAMYAEYKTMCKAGEFRPGDVFDYDYGAGHVYNLATELTWRTRAKEKAKIEYIEQSLRRMLEMAARSNVGKIAMPAIGAGLGGLQWEDVKAVIDSVAGSNTDVELYVVEEYRRV